MKEVSGEMKDGRMIVRLSGKIDSANAGQAEEAITDLIKDAEGHPLLIDAKDLIYISSAGLRVLLRLRKRFRDMTILNASSEVYEILEMTGFTEMMTVEKAYRQVSIEGCEVIGEGNNGTVYRIDGDNVVKVYNDADALDEIQNEREVARLALILGIPTAISYDVVRVGDTYGSVFEMLDASSFSKIIAEHPEKEDWCVREYAALLDRIHGTVVPEGKLPDMRETVIGWVASLKGFLPEESYEKLDRLVQDIPKDDHMIHGDLHTKNIQLTGDEVMLIDMDTLAAGHPVFELAFMYNAFVGYGEYDPDVVTRFIGFDAQTAKRFWRRSLAMYLGTDDEEALRRVEDKARIIGYMRMIRRALRIGRMESEDGAAEIALWKGELIELIEKTDSLTFSRDEIFLEALKENLPEILDFLEKKLEAARCPEKTRMQIALAVEEIFINIASYAYSPETGYMLMRIESGQDPASVTITFIDHGKPYDPLATEEPDVTLAAEDRKIGGLGIFLVRRMTDDIDYEYKDGYNILTLKKQF